MDEAVVPDDVRHALVEFAATAIGRMPANEIPGPLRPIARFTPSKRARQGATQLWAEVTENGDFRSSLAEVASTALADLAEQVRGHAVEESADRVAAGMLRFLLRPEGWQEDLAQLDEDLRLERDRRDVENELARANDALARARTAVDDMARARDEARAAGEARVTRFEDEIVRLKKEIRALKGLLGKAENAAAAASERTADLEAKLKRAEDELGAEAGRHLRRIASLEADLDAARRSGRAARDYDEVRLWLLLEQLSHAADGLRGMGLARDPGLRPAELGSDAPETDEGRMSVLDERALDRLLHGQHVHLIVDGYNLTKAGYPELSLADQRTRLINSARALAQRRSIEVTVVFDGQAAVSGAALPPSGVRHFRVRFSAKGQIADDLIRELLSHEPPGRVVVVASSDNEVAASARFRRAWSVRADTMLDRLARG